MAADASVKAPPAALAVEAAPPAAEPAAVMTDLAVVERLATLGPDDLFPWNDFSMRTKSFSEATSSGYSTSIGLGEFLSASTVAPFAGGLAFVSFFASLPPGLPLIAYWLNVPS